MELTLAIFGIWFAFLAFVCLLILGIFYVALRFGSIQ